VLLAPSAAAFAAEQRPEVVEEEISVTATRAPRRSRDVPQAIAVVGREQIQDKVTFNVKDVVVNTPGVLVESKNGGYDSRLLIRGAGLKANYGVREIMVLRDGVPLTDPDSLSRLDWIDTQDIERIEISKGPGNLFSPGSAGGAIQIISRSVFDPGADAGEAAYGSFGAANVHLRSSATLAGTSLAATASYRRQENGWRLWNEFETFQASLKHGVRIGQAGTLESEVAYTKADMQLPGAMSPALYAEFEDTGRQSQTSEPWKHSGRYSNILFLNTKLERPAGAFVLRPRLYFNQWDHLHPVTGFINDTVDWTRTLGTDLEAQHAHALGLARGTLVFGLTAKGQWNDDVRRYQYRDVTRNPATNRIEATLSDEKGALMETQAQRNVLAGLFVQESLQAWGRVTLDLGLRLDRSWLRVRSDELTRYDFARGDYVPGDGPSVTEKVFDLPAPKAGLSVRVTDAVSVYGSVASAAQVPSESEVLTNPELSPARSTAYEVGAKARSGRFTLDAAGYLNRVEDEIVSVATGGTTEFQNAGETRKLGVELAGSVRLPGGLEAGASWAYSDFTYVRFLEVVRGASADRSGNRLPYVPWHQYGAFASWRHPSGLRLRVQTSTWGRYWMDNANTASYRGYSFVTSVGAAWALGRHEVLLDAANVLDAHYAMQAVKDVQGVERYTAATPRTVILGYRFRLGGGPP
jgi:iron complex outermembrane receptor protein